MTCARVSIAGAALVALLAPGWAADLAAGQRTPPIDLLVSILRPVLPYPAADANGDLPEDGSAQSKWFVVGPTADDPRVIVRANPLHPDTQSAAADAMAKIQEAVVAAERKAQAAYDRALEELRRTGKGANIESVTLDDEGIEGERIDAELELTIEIDPSPAVYEIGTAKAPQVNSTASGAAFTVLVPANAYREGSGTGARQRFRPAEARLYFGLSTPPAIARGDGDRYKVTIAPAAGTFGVVLRGNEALVQQVLAQADWTRFRP